MSERAGVSDDARTTTFSYPPRNMERVWKKLCEKWLLNMHRDTMHYKVLQFKTKPDVETFHISI
jgi:hypothetical protein